MQWFWIIFLFAVGACLGSFLNVVIYRLPRGQSVVFPMRSFCPNCGRTIRSHDNIPLVSWFVLGGRCRDCKGPISPRYVLIEAAAAVLLVGLYVCYYVVAVREGAGRLADSWPMFLAHAALLYGLLASAVVDAEFSVIPLEVMWICSGIGIASAALQPHRFLDAARVSPDVVAASLAAIAGLVIAKGLVRWGFLQPSFLDAEPAGASAEQPAVPKNDSARKERRKKRKKRRSNQDPAPAAKTVGITAAHGVNPRREILREVAFLAPAILLGAAVLVLFRHVPAAARPWRDLLNLQVHPSLAPHIVSGGAAVFGFLIGGLWIWGTRILGTLAFGKEAMGMGDVHLLAAVGAVMGWIVPSLVFFVAPIIGLLWALFLWATRRQRELPYGPWLAAGALVVMIGYDGMAEWLQPFAHTMQILLDG